ncbi:MAG: glycerol-3-phosphate dehydrogenase/oxidase [Actinomycetia bacterium]|nr:glycerol-3-phosphate dehydrogenase/oxidase [Actinomycetes bacterium]
MALPITIAPGDPAARLNAETRARARDRAASGLQLDVLVIGGGVTGTGVALDAASRGLTVALVERGDFASGTSSYSSKLVHGGLRYLATGDVGVAWESAIERGYVAGTIAPHLIRPLPQIAPLYAGEQKLGYLTGAGFFAGDVLKMAARTPRGLLKGWRRLGKRRTLELAPGLNPDGLKGGMLGWECQLEDDARLVIALARTAAAYGALMMTQTTVDAITPAGAQVHDSLTGESFYINAKHVINAAGVWAGQLDQDVELTPSVGSHAIVRSERLGNSTAALIVPVPGETGRFVFSLPQPDGLTYLGITDNPLAGPIPEHINAPVADISWIIDTVSEVLAVPLTLEDVVGTYAGMRPLVRSAPSVDPTGNTDSATRDAEQSDTEDRTADISRRHLVSRHDNVVTIAGGKLTTYRRMANDAVDLVSDRPCLTTRIALVGAGAKPPVPGIPDRLWRRYGNEAPTVWDLGVTNPKLRVPVAPGSDVLGVEFAFGLEHELALSVDDLLDRRTRVGLVPQDADLIRGAAQEMLTPESASVGHRSSM